MPLGAFKAALMGTAGVSTAGDWDLISNTDHSGVDEVIITSGFLSAYSEIIFGFYNINPATDDTDFTFQASIDGGSNYNITMNSSYQNVHQPEADSGHIQVTYQTGFDQVGAAFQVLFDSAANDADGSMVGKLHLYSPKSTTYVKHFRSYMVGMNSNSAAQGVYVGGYFNDADDDINAIQFKMDSGAFDGTVKMWGVK